MGNKYKSPELIRSMQIPPLREQRYERYLPTAFDESLSILERINKIIHYLHHYSHITEEMIGKWNEVYRWVMNDGLDSSITERLREYLDDGTFQTIINETIFNELNNKVDKVVDDLENIKGDLDKTINDAKNELDEQIDGMIDEVYNMTKNLTQIIVSKDEPADFNANTLWYGVVE